MDEFNKSGPDVFNCDQDFSSRKVQNPHVVKQRSGKQLSENEVLFRHVMSIMNKLMPQNINKLTNDLIKLPINSEDRLKGSIEIIFEKSIDEPVFSQTYAQLCNVLAQIRVPQTADPTKFTSFRTMLLTKCQRAFDTDYKKEINYDQLVQEAENCTDEAKKKELKELAEEKLSKAKRKSLGNIRFIGELFKLNMLTESIMFDCIERLLKHESDEESIECLCIFLTTIGKELERSDNRIKMNSVFDRLDGIIKKRNIVSGRIRFMILDVIDLRRENWVPRRKKETPKKIGEIRREVMEKEMKLQREAQTFTSQAIEKRMFIDNGVLGGSNKLKMYQKIEDVAKSESSIISQHSENEAIMKQWNNNSGRDGQASENATTFFGYDGEEGLCENHSKRVKKIESLIKMLSNEFSKRILISAHPQTGKTAMTQLFDGYFKENKLKNQKDRLKDLEGRKLFNISFKGFNPSRKSLDEFFFENTKISLAEFRTRVVSDPSVIVVIDEAQKIYHETEFWQQFKASTKQGFITGAAGNADVSGGCCSVLAFALLAPRVSNNSPQFDALPGAPVTIGTRLWYSFMALDDDELSEIWVKFVAKDAVRFNSKVLEFIKENVSLRLANRQIYHPGLTLACLSLIGDGYTVDSLQQRNQLYSKLKKIYRPRCLRSICYVQENFKGLLEKFLPSNAAMQSKAFDEFPAVFDKMARTLISGRSIELKLSDDVSRAYYELLECFICCAVTDVLETDSQTNTPTEKVFISLSCMLFNAHLLAELAYLQRSCREYGLKTKFDNVEELVKFVIRQFCPDRLLCLLRDKYSHEKAYQQEFLMRANRYTSQGVDSDYLLFAKELSSAQDDSQMEFLDGTQLDEDDAFNEKELDMEGLTKDELDKIDAIDFITEGKLTWGIEFTSSSIKLKDHVRRFHPTTGRYMNKQPKLERTNCCVVDCYYDKMPSANRYKSISAQDASIVLIAVFAKDMTKVDFYKPSFSSQVELGKPNVQVEFKPIEGGSDLTNKCR